MKILSSFALFFLLYLHTSAQFVTINDAIVINAITSKCPAAFTGNQLDTTNSCLITVTDLSLSGGSDFNGLQYLKALNFLEIAHPDPYSVFPLFPVTLTTINLLYDLKVMPDLSNLPFVNSLYVADCNMDTIRNLPQAVNDLAFVSDSINFIDAFPSSATYITLNNNQLTVLPPLPSNVQTLSLTQNLVTSIPVLPVGITTFNAYDNPVSAMPVFPNSLTSISVGGASWTGNVLPASLPPNLESFTCSYVQTLTLPPLPSSLRTLYAAYCNLTSLPPLPAGLTYFHIYNNPLLPALTSLPTGLQVLSCSYNNWSSLPALAPTIKFLTCDHNQFTALPALPDSLYNLICSDNLLTSLPALPVKTNTIWCQNNSITQLPPLPDSLTYLNCSYNPLTSLSSFPSKLQTLVATNCDINYFTSLPSSVTAASLRYNNLTALPAFNQPLTSINLNVRDNPLTCLPYLPNKITLDVRTTFVTCKPNTPPISTFNPATLPLCDTMNTICPLYPKLSGSFFYDVNQNGVKDVSEQALPFVTFSIDSGYYYNASDSAGNFVSSEIDTGMHTITILNTYFNVTTPLTPFHLSYNNTLNLTPIGIYYTSGIIDMQAFLTDGIYPPNPGFAADYYLTSHNNGTTACNPLVTFAYDTLLSNITAVPAPDSISNNTAYWNFSLMNPSEIRTIKIDATTDVNAVINQPLTNTATVNCPVTDNTPGDNTFILTQNVVGSFDPNSKSANVKEVVYGNGSNPSFISYTVNFQNTGNYPATFVIISDTLDSQLDLSSFLILNASHAYAYEINNRVLKVTFSNINLPDSNSNEPQSHGFISYAIKPLTGLNIGVHILNTAYIYFDFNTPVVTNTVDLPVVLVPTGISVIKSQGGLTITPNPFADHFIINFDEAALDLMIADMYGRTILSENISAKNSSALKIKTSSWPKGLYVVTIKQLSGKKIFKKLVKN